MNRGQRSLLLSPPPLPHGSGPFHPASWEQLSMVDGKAWLTARRTGYTAQAALAPLAGPAKANGLVRQGAKRQGSVINRLPLSRVESMWRGS